MAKKVIVAGGGASGLVAAVTAAENGARVTVLEHKDRVGKKILMTGNGKCNLTNMSDVHGKYYSSDTESLEQIYDTLVRFDAQETMMVRRKNATAGCIRCLSRRLSCWMCCGVPAAGLA